MKGLKKAFSVVRYSLLISSLEITCVTSFKSVCLRSRVKFIARGLRSRVRLKGFAQGLRSRVALTLKYDQL